MGLSLGYVFANRWYSFTDSVDQATKFWQFLEIAKHTWYGPLTSPKQVYSKSCHLVILCWLSLGTYDFWADGSLLPYSGPLGKCLHHGLSCSSWIPSDRKQPANLLPFPGRPFLQIWLYCQGPALRRCSVHFVGHSKHHLPKTKQMILHMDITRWSISKSNWLYSGQLKMEKLYIVSKNKTWSWLWLRPLAPYCKIQA